MRLVTFLQSLTGRTLRVVAGALVMWFGLAEVGGAAGIAIAVLGAVPILTGLLHVCLLGPLLGLDMTSYRAMPK